MISRRTVYQLFIAASFLLGRAIPAFYRWTGSDQSRPSPLIGQFALGMTIAGVVACLLLPYLTLDQESSDTTTDARVRFDLRTLFAAMAAIAIVVVSLTKFPLIVSSVLLVTACIQVGRFVWQTPQHRWSVGGLLGCMYLPFAWLVDFGDIESMGQVLAGIAVGLPMLLPAGLLSSMFGQNLHESSWLAIFMSAAALVFGTWIIRLGPKRTIAYLIVLLLVSVFSSFCLHAITLA